MRSWRGPMMIRVAASETNGMKNAGMFSEIPSPTAARRWLLLVLALGLLLRLWNIDYPVWKQPDEQNIVDRALMLGHSGLNPRWFAYPSSFLYVLFAADGVMYTGGHLLGIFTSPEQFAAFYFGHPLVFHLIARGLVMACGMASLIVVFGIGRAGWGPGVGVAAAGILAVSPVWVDFSRLAKQDMMMVLLLLVAAYGVLRSLETEGRGWLWAAGVLVGLAASTKYTAGLGVVWLPAVAWIRRRGRAAVVEGAGALGLAALAFVVGTPYAVLDWSTFRADFTSMANLMQGTWYGAEDRQGYTYYLFHAFPWALGWPGALLGILGCGRWLYRGGTRERLLAGFAVAFYGWMGYSRVANEHYVLPVVPILALAGADLVRAAISGRWSSHPRRGAWIVGGLAAVCLAQPLAWTLRETALLPARDTRDLAGGWITEHVAPGTRILSESYGPFLALAPGRLDELIAEEERAHPGRGMRLRYERAQAQARKGYWYNEMQLFAHEFLSQPDVSAYDLDRVLAQRYTIVVLSSTVYGRYRRHPGRYPIQNAFFDRVTRTGRLLIRVDQATPWCCPRTWNERVAEAAAGRWGRPGPTLLVYRLREQP